MPAPALAAKAAALALGGAAALVLTHGSGGTVGAGIQGTPVRLAAAAAPGSSHELRVLVVDTGNGQEDMTVRADQLSHRPGWLPVPSAWISPATVTLSAGHSAIVTLRLAVPAGARPGRYRTDIEALSGTAAASGSGGTAVFAAGAATGLIFRIARLTEANQPSAQGVFSTPKR